MARPDKETVRWEFEDLLNSDPQFSQVYDPDEFDEWYEDHYGNQ